MIQVVASNRPRKMDGQQFHVPKVFWWNPSPVN